jgi:hypothetical protein
MPIGRPIGVPIGNRNRNRNRNNNNNNIEKEKNETMLLIDAYELIDEIQAEEDAAHKNERKQRERSDWVEYGKAKGMEQQSELYSNTLRRRSLIDDE